MLKIGFVLGGVPIAPVYSWKEILKNSKPGLNSFSYEEYWKVRGLEFNQDFENAIIEARIKLKLPKQGLSYDDYLKYSDLGHDGGKVDDEIDEILRRYDCDSFVKKHVKTILLANFVLPSSPLKNDSGDLSLETLFDEADIENLATAGEAIIIKITSSGVTNNAIKQFLKDRENELSSLIKRLPEKEKFILSEEKLKVHQLKKIQNLPYGAISVKISEMTGEEPKNVEALKKSYESTRSAITHLFHPKVKNFD